MTLRRFSVLMVLAVLLEMGCCRWCYRRKCFRPILRRPVGVDGCDCITPATVQGQVTVIPAPPAAPLVSPLAR
jgi:hypothetical protein